MKGRKSEIKEEIKPRVIVEKGDIYRIKAASLRLQAYLQQLQVEELRLTVKELELQNQLKDVFHSKFKVETKKGQKNEYQEALDAVIKELESKYQTALKNRTINEFTGEIVEL